MEFWLEEEVYSTLSRVNVQDLFLTIYSSPATVAVRKPAKAVVI